jgi:hypothetical protein
MEPLNAKDAKRYAEFKEWTPFEAALLLAGCKPLPRGHIPEPNGNTPAFNLIQAIQICGLSKNMKTPHPPKVWMSWYSEHLAGSDFPDFSLTVIRAFGQNKAGGALEIFAKSALITPEIASEKPWCVHDSRDPHPEQAWYTPARYFARQLVIQDRTLLKKREMVADKVSRSLADLNIFKRGGKKNLSPSTILKAFANVKFD